MKKQMPWEIVGEIDDPNAKKKLWLLKPVGSTEEGDEFIVGMGFSYAEKFPDAEIGGNADAEEFNRLVTLYPLLVCDDESDPENSGNLLWLWVNENHCWQKGEFDSHAFIYDRNISRLERLAALGKEAVCRAVELWNSGDKHPDLEFYEEGGHFSAVASNLDTAVDQAIKEFTARK